MQKTNWISVALLTLFVVSVVSVIGCGEKNVVQPTAKVGLSAAERKSKRGD
jgi:hypothetical protein